MLFYVNHTSYFERYTGVQCTVRAIAKGLMEIGVPLKPVLWDWEQGGFISAPMPRLEHLSRWNEPFEFLVDRESELNDH